MDKWFSLDLGDAVLATAVLIDLRDRLKQVYEESGQPDGMAAWYRHESGRLHCHLVVYLTNALQEVASLKEAVPCQPPDLSGLSMLVGPASGPENPSQ